jgi:hypothetical protein
MKWPCARQGHSFFQAAMARRKYGATGKPVVRRVFLGAPELLSSHPDPLRNYRASDGSPGHSRSSPPTPIGLAPK